MIELVNTLAEQYAHIITSNEDELLMKVDEFTKQHHAMPHMLSGKTQGAFLSLISKLICPLHILEIGTFTGYSALCLVKGLKKEGYLHTIEIREADANSAKEFFKQSDQNSQIVLHLGDAKKIIPTLPHQWDLVFIDADKTGYIDYYELLLPSVKKNGIIIADNVLFHGQVLAENIQGKNAKAIHEFNQHVQNDDRVEQVLLKVRDGLLIIRKR
jgi:spermidine synthase